MKKSLTPVRIVAFLSLSKKNKKKSTSASAGIAAPAAPAAAPAAPTSTNKASDADDKKNSNNDDKVIIITEGRASISQRAHEVFYNPVQVVNRDLSVACLRVFAARRRAEAASGRAPKAPRSGREDNSGDRRKQQNKKKQQEREEGQEQEQEKEGGGNGSTGIIPAPPPRRPAAAGEPAGGGGLRVLEGLAATGLRALRYALEIDAVDSVHAVDLDPSAVAAMRRNVALNCSSDDADKSAGGDTDGGGGAKENPTSSTPPPRARKVHPAQGDARLVMLANANCYDVVDLDPYGSPATLLDAAVRAVSHGGEEMFFPSFFFEKKIDKTLTNSTKKCTQPSFPSPSLPPKKKKKSLSQRPPLRHRHGHGRPLRRQPGVLLLEIRQHAPAQALRPRAGAAHPAGGGRDGRGARGADD